MMESAAVVAGNQVVLEAEAGPLRRDIVGVW